MNIRYIYKGTDILLKEFNTSYERPYFEVTGFASYKDRVYIPPQVNGCEVRGISLSDRGDHRHQEGHKAGYPGIRELHFEAAVKRIDLNNTDLPDLERICFQDDQTDYQFSEGMLFDRSGRRLLLTFGRGMHDEEIRIPPGVGTVASNAFRDTQVKRIIFTDPWIIIEGNPFRDSYWIAGHRQTGTSIYTGNMLFRYFGSDEAVIDPSTERIDDDCFEVNCPEKLVTCFIPRDKVLKQLDAGGCRSITITSDISIPWETLRNWKHLEKVRLPAHSKYYDKDGIVFDRAEDMLVFYPPGRTGEEYLIPDGTKLIGSDAFDNHKNLKRVVFSHTVTEILPGAFFGCSKLESVDMKRCKVKKLPDATVFNDKGVFEGCECLTEIKLPEVLEHIGSRAFYGAVKLSAIHPDCRLRSIGSYAFSKTAIDEISLPESVEYIAPGAFADRSSSEHLSISMYGRAERWLLEALEYTQPGLPPTADRLTWQGADITFLDNSGHTGDILHIPGSLDPAYGHYIDRALAGDSFDNRSYVMCLGGIRNEEEKRAFALKIEAEGKDADNICRDYIRRVAPQIADGYVRDGEEKLLVDLLKKEFIEAHDMRDLLKKCSDKGLNQASAYILHLLNSSSEEMITALQI